MSIRHLIHKIWLCENSTLKIQGQGHGWGESWKSQHGSNILSTLIPSIPCQSAIPFLRYDFFKIWPFLKIQGQSHSWDQSWKSQSGCYILSTHIPFVPCHSALPFPRYSIFKLWPWKSKVKVMVEGMLKVTTWVQHSIDSHPFRSMSIGPPIPEIQHFQNLTLKIQGQGHGWGGHWKSQHGSNILLTHIPLIPSQSAIPFLRYDFFKIWPWKSKVKVMGEGNVESHKVGVTCYRLTSLSFHVNRASHSWVMTFSKFDLEN